eukprot:SAG22_NODE_2737_length_2263_cov_1.926063_2_plen_116_part_00
MDWSQSPGVAAPNSLKGHYEACLDPSSGRLEPAGLAQLAEALALPAETTRALQEEQAYVGEGWTFKTFVVLLKRIDYTAFNALDQHGACVAAAACGIRQKHTLRLWLCCMLPFPS